jgi:hypothetical protein
MDGLAARLGRLAKEANLVVSDTGQWALSRAVATSRMPSATAQAAIMSGRGPTRCATVARGRRREWRGAGAARSTSIRRWPGRISRTPRRTAGRPLLPAATAARRSPSLRRSIRSRTSSTSAHQARASEARGIGGDANSAPGGKNPLRYLSSPCLRKGLGDGAQRAQCPATAATKSATASASLPW